MPSYTARDLIRANNKIHGENTPLPPRPRKMNNEESRMQQALVSWWSVACVDFGVPQILLFAIGNGGKRDAVTGAIMKREGVRAGVADLFLSVPRGGKPGAYIELKKPDGELSPLQREFLKLADAQGYACRVCYSVRSAIEFIAEYLGK